jgi:S-adenosylmethionine:tRNA ribosyltransferase-isomerase
MQKKDFDYYLPEHLIAQSPLDKRVDSRLLVCNKYDNTIQHKHFVDICDYLQAGDVIVANNTRVLPARLQGVLDNSKQLEILLHKRLSINCWEILVKNANRYKPHTRVVFGNILCGYFVQDRHNGNRIMQFEYSGLFEEILNNIGSMPIPHYIKQTLYDSKRYQTVYAIDKGDSVAAPTAGLHFDDALISRLKANGIQWVDVCLNVGLGTFRPVKTDNLTEHKMHSEYFELTQSSADTINLAKSQGRRIIAVGTTSVRVLESAVDEDGQVQAQSRDTDIFIYPPYQFRVVDGLITNFHLPESTLIMLVSALYGHANTMQAYKIAVENGYRFFSFGDAMLIV